MKKHYKVLTEKEYNAIKSMIDFGATTRVLRTVTGRAPSTIHLIRRFDSFESYLDYNRKRNAKPVAALVVSRAEHSERALPVNESTLTYGGKLVGLSFNPAGSATVHEIKERAAGLIDVYNTERTLSENPEVIRAYSIAIHDLEGSAMWAVKAATKEVPNE